MASSGVEIIFVSSDRSPEDMVDYMKESHGDWFGVEHGSDVVDELSKKFGVSGIPYLVVLKSDGTVITKDGRSAVQGQAESYGCHRRPSSCLIFVLRSPLPRYWSSGRWREVASSTPPLRLRVRLPAQRERDAYAHTLVHELFDC